MRAVGRPERVVHVEVAERGEGAGERLVVLLLTCVEPRVLEDQHGAFGNLPRGGHGGLVGGAMACTFFRAMQLETGTSLVEPDRVQLAATLLERAGFRLTLPHDAVVAPALDQPGAAHAVRRDAIPAAEAMYDIGPDTMASYTRAITSAQTVLWNGPMGVFETPPFNAGTLAVAKAMAAATQRGATTIVGGGDSAAAVTEAGLEGSMSHVSTGGGASLEFLEGKSLPGVAALDDR